MKTRIAIAFTLALTLLLSACGAAAPAVTDPLTVTILSIGKADAMFLTCGDATMVIDAGETDDGKELVNALAWQDRQRVDVLIITHFDRDHVGGAARLVKKLEVARVILPAYEGQNEEYQNLLAELEKKGIEPERLTKETRFTLGCAEVLVEPPAAYPAEITGDSVDNELSLITTVTHGSQRLVFTGDAEKGRLQEYLAGSPAPCTFLKFPHHGDYNKALPELVQALKPSYTVICDSAKNPAEERTLALLEREGVTCYETKDGAVRIESDGKSLTLTQAEN